MDDKDVEIFVTGVSGKVEINHDSSGPTEVDQKEAVISSSEFFEKDRE